MKMDIKKSAAKLALTGLLLTGGAAAFAPSASADSGECNSTATVRIIDPEEGTYKCNGSTELHVYVAPADATSEQNVTRLLPKGQAGGGLSTTTASPKFEPMVKAPRFTGKIGKAWAEASSRFNNSRG